MGFTEVYDYVAGKLDWLAAGLPTEGSNAERPRAGDVARKDVPTCGVDERLGDVAQRVRASGWNTCVVVDEGRIVFGRLRAEELDGDADRRVEEVMRPGPSTFRPHVSAAEMGRYMREHDLESSPITRSNGELIGMLVREDAESAAKQGNEHEHGE